MTDKGSWGPSGMSPDESLSFRLLPYRGVVNTNFGKGRWSCQPCLSSSALSRMILRSLEVRHRATLTRTVQKETLLMQFCAFSNVFCVFTSLSATSTHLIRICYSEQTMSRPLRLHSAHKDPWPSETVATVHLWGEDGFPEAALQSLSSETQQPCRQQAREAGSVIRLLQPNCV